MSPLSRTFMAVLLCLAAALAMVGCSRPATESGSGALSRSARGSQSRATGPEADAALGFVRSVQTEPVDTAYEKLSPLSRETVTREEFAKLVAPPDWQSSASMLQATQAQGCAVETVDAQADSGSVVVRLDGTRPIPIAVCREGDKWWADLTDVGQLRVQASAQIAAFTGRASSPWAMAMLMSEVGGMPATATLASPLLSQCEAVSIEGEGDHVIVMVQGAGTVRAIAPARKGYGGWSVNWEQAIAVEWEPGGAGPEASAEALTVARAQAQTTACQSNLKQLALGMLMYAQDYNEKFPPAERWEDAIRLYVKNFQIFTCPAVPSQEHGYAFNRALSGKSLGGVPRPAETILVYESAAGQKNAADDGSSWPEPPRHGTSNGCAYADGHVKLMPSKPTFGP